MKEKLIMYGLIGLAFLYFGALLLDGPAMASKYESYDSETVAELTNINFLRRSAGKTWVTEYIVDYSFTVNGKTYEDSTSYLSSVPEDSTSVVRYDSRNPKDNVLILEKENAVDTSMGGIIIIAIIGGLYAWSKFRKR